MNTAERAALIESTVQVVADCGFHGGSMSLIAGRAEVAAGTAYVLFESKDHLLLETYRVLERRCLAAVMEDYPLQGTVRQRFSHLAYGLICHFMLFPQAFLFADQFLSSPYRKVVAPHYLPDTELNGILQFFREGTKKSLFKEMPPAMLLALACGPLIQVIRAHAAGFLYLDDDRISRTVEACWETVSLQKMSSLRRRQDDRRPQGNCRGSETRERQGLAMKIFGTDTPASAKRNSLKH